MNAPTLRRRLVPAVGVRLERLLLGKPLSEVARRAEMSLHRASIVERFPERARPGELDRLRAALSADPKEG